MCNKHQQKPKQDNVEPVDVENISNEQEDLHHNPSYESLILKESNPDYALSTSSDINPAYENTSTIKMDPNPAYASTNM